MILAFVSGATTMGFFVAALFFLRFWRNTEEELFLLFALAFGLLGFGHILLSIGGVPAEERSWLYLIRLVAYLLILFAIVRKNLSAR
ncbi:DUF5985 family protein [Sphingomonas sp. KR3-1]|uniref:DUF5985 family protein n=1 Tax=Sphingomonas sp. KR3-1 TaxID=3156611 RepID=UPI0032B42A16